ncbi:MAG: type II toxin-antitoxin system antitoxin SocA domain-containing protein [Planctomycetota bacterium]
MVTVFDVARYILDKRGTVGAMSLQKLCYYAQAWHLAWEGEALFVDDFEAWRDGPVVRDLWTKSARRISLLPPHIDGVPDRLSEAQRLVVDAVLQAHGAKTGRELSALTHREGPWVDTRIGLRPGEGSRRVIPKERMAVYFKALGEHRTDWSEESVDDALARFIANNDNLLRRLA